MLVDFTQEVVEHQRGVGLLAGSVGPVVRGRKESREGKKKEIYKTAFSVLGETTGKGRYHPFVRQESPLSLILQNVMY